MTRPTSERPEPLQGTWLVNRLSYPQLDDIAERAVAAERARLREAVEGLDGQCHDGEGLGCETFPCVENVSRDQVLALLGEPQ